MKIIVLSLSMLLFVGVSFSQCPVKYPNEITINLIGGGANYGGYSLRMFGEDAEKLKDALITEYPKYKLRGSRYIIKNVIIPGIEESITLQIYQGKHEINDSTTTFSSFKNIEEKKQYLSKLGHNQSLGVYVYFKKKRKNAFKEIEEAKIAKAYFESLYKG